MEDIAFTVSARTARLIGQENFANAEGAIIELVKNSYDADASVCVIVIDSLKNKIYIIDNGIGMSKEKINDNWMIIGTNDKQDNFKSSKLRIKTGAKGIGRFALDRLGYQCKLTSKMKETKNGIFWSVDWHQFEVKNQTIDRIMAKFDVIKNFDIDKYIFTLDFPKYLNNILTNQFLTNHGTILEINQLKDDWEEKEIEELFTNLENLIPPLETTNFEIFLCDPNSPGKYGKVEPTLCDDYDYKLIASADENQNVNIKLYRNELLVNELDKLAFFKKTKLSNKDFSIEAFQKEFLEYNLKIENLIPGYKETDKQNRLNRIGPFLFSFYFLKRGGGQEKKDDENIKFPYKPFNIRDRVNWLDKFSGIKIYRDNFRVRPYGEVSSSSYDWLDLGKRALKNPTVTRPGYQVRPQQIYGIVKISRIDNIDFQDKSSREGLQENEIFQLFKELLIAIIEKFEFDRNQIMMSLKRIYDDNNPKSAAKSKLKEKISKKKNTDNTNADEQNKEEEDKIIEDAVDAYETEIDELHDEQKLLKILASTGLIVTTFAHELKNLCDRIVPRTDDLKVILEELIEQAKLIDRPEFNNPFIMLSDMRKQDERLQRWLDFSLSSIRKDKRSLRTINLVDYLDELERMWSSMMNKKQIQLSVSKKNFLEVYYKAHEIDIDSIFNNLFANSIDAFDRKDAGNERRIDLSFSFEPTKGIFVTYQDTGPGLSLDIIDPNIIFEPFFTTKRDKKTGKKTGHGLGMWIVKSVIEDYRGDIEIVKLRPGFGVKFKLPI